MCLDMGQLTVDKVCDEVQNIDDGIMQKTSSASLRPFKHQG